MVWYLVTIRIDPKWAQDWHRWMVAAHIPDVLRTGFFRQADICRVVEPREKRPTYLIRYQCESMDDYRAYAENAAPALQKEHTERFQGKFAASRTVVLHQGSFDANQETP